MAKIRLALVDDHRIVRDGLKALLQSLERFEVVAEVGDGEAAIALATDPDIDVFLMDISMPGISGLDAAARIVALHPQARIIMLSMHATSEYVNQAFECGALGYILKSMDPGELETAIFRVAAGHRYLTPVAAELLDSAGAETMPGSEKAARLTTRQREILRLTANGMSTRDIAEHLSISSKTVETHRSQLMQNLDIFDVPGLVRYAVRHGIVSVE